MKMLMASGRALAALVTSSAYAHQVPQPARLLPGASSASTHQVTPSDVFLSLNAVYADGSHRRPGSGFQRTSPAAPRQDRKVLIPIRRDAGMRSFRRQGKRHIARRLVSSALSGLLTRISEPPSPRS